MSANLTELLTNLFQGGLGNLAAYLAAHVLLCLVPAFYIAGAMSALVPKDSITRFLGRSAPKFISYPAAALAGSVLAVCSCTIVPLFAGIYKKGAGIGPAITFLFFAPAGNILALAYTGVAIGADLAFARLILSLAFGIGIGMIMALTFRRSDQQRAEQADQAFAGRGRMPRASALFLLLLVALLLTGTLKIDWLSIRLAEAHLALPQADAWQGALDRLVPADTVSGQEGLSLHGLALIVLLGLIGVAAWRGMEPVLERPSRWTWTALGLVAATLLVAALSVQTSANGLTIGLNGRTVLVGLELTALGWLGAKGLGEHERRAWLWESWRFVKQIFPLLIVGVFAVGVLRQLIQPAWIQALAGENTPLGNLAGVIFGVFMYFPTLVEVPIANMFLSLGMHRGPLLAYLMSDPELSLQSILMISAIVGRVKAWTYVAWVALFSALAGWMYGRWVDGASAWLVAGYLAVFLGLLAGGLALAGRNQKLRKTSAVSLSAD
jgi:uncharacterized membrane protein YraQ (UPF0718 family)